jgi:riboflavin kinase/FMN adenylyltransferase
VRQAVVQGDLEELHRLLGRPYSVLGKVVPGDGRGRTLGFPTANLDVEGAAVPPVGVYFAHVRRVPRADSEQVPAGAAAGEEIGGALVNLGKRPTFYQGGSSGVEETVEVHLPGFSGDLYDSWLELSFLQRHRPEKKFASADELSAQIRADVEAFRMFEEAEARRRGEA